MKECPMCKKNKENTEFYNSNKTKDKLSCYCKECSKKKKDDYKKTKEGVIHNIYYAQCGNSKKRNHTPPKYTKKELVLFLKNNNKFKEIYDNWVKSGYQRGLRPSLDRIKENIGYSFDNIEITTWKANNHKSFEDNKKNNTKEVIQFKNGIEIKRYYSASEAHRQTKINRGHINEVCRAERGQAGGFYWSFG